MSAGGEGSLKLEPGDQNHSPVAQLLKAALEGRLSHLRSRELKYWEPAKLNETHIQMILMRASGMRQTEIARALEVTDANVSIVLNHPDAVYVLSQLVGRSADFVVDVRSRLRSYAGEMLDSLVHTARTTGDDKVRVKVAFGLIDRAGYGQVQESKVTHEIQVSDRSMERLSVALEKFAEDETGQDVTEYASYVQNGSEAVAEPLLPAPASNPSRVESPPLNGSQNKREVA